MGLVQLQQDLDVVVAVSLRREGGRERRRLRSAPAGHRKKLLLSLGCSGCPGGRGNAPMGPRLPAEFSLALLARVYTQPQTGITHLRVLALEDALLFLFFLGVPDQLREGKQAAITHPATPVMGKLSCSVPGPHAKKEAAPGPATDPTFSYLYRQLPEEKPQPDPSCHPQLFKCGGCVMRWQTVGGWRKERSHLYQYGTAAPSSVRIKAWLTALHAARVVRNAPLPEDLYFIPLKQGRRAKRPGHLN